MKELISKEMVAFPEYDVWSNEHTFDKSVMTKEVGDTPKLEEVSLYTYKGVELGDDIAEDERTYRVLISVGYEKDSTILFAFTLEEDYKGENNVPYFNVRMEVEYFSGEAEDMTVLKMGELANYATRIFCAYGFDKKFGKTSFK